MKKFFIVLSLFLASFISNNSFADPYIGMIGGGTAGFDLNKSRVDTSCGYYVGGRLGFSCCELLRIEEEFSYQRSGVDSLSKRGFQLNHVHGHVNVWSLMTNLIVDLDCPFIISPYFGGGVGYAREDGKGNGEFPFKHQTEGKEKFHRDAFAWQAIIGFKYCVCFGFEAGLEYRYFKIKETDANHKFGLALTKFF